MSIYGTAGQFEFLTGLCTGVYVVVGISNSVLSILTANFPVRIEKKKVCMIVLILTGMFSVSIEKTKFA